MTIPLVLTIGVNIQGLTSGSSIAIKMNETDIKTEQRNLINCLNLIGASDEYIQYRISCFKTMETMYSVANLGRNSLEGFFIGSQIEGGTLVGLDSDEDLMFIFKAIYIITDADELKNKSNLNDSKNTYGRTDHLGNRNDRLYRENILTNPAVGLIEEADASPGYAKVIAFNKDKLIPLSKDDESSLFHLFEVDEDGRCLFSHRKLKKRIASVTPTRQQNGPAMTEDSTKTFKSSDLVYGLNSSFWPKSAKEWLTRDRKYSWPLRETIELTKNGCFLVPVGPTRTAFDTEWRLSFTLLERELIWTWTIVQYKCYMLLKIIKKDLIERELPDIVSSYHMKTVMFWMSEEKPIEFWNKENIAVCIIQCIDKFVEFVEIINCPNYFIPKNNMFDGKLSPTDQKILLEVLYRFRKRFWIEIFELQTIQNVVEKVSGAKDECFENLKLACMRNPTLMTETVNLHYSVLINFATSAMKPVFQLLSDHDVDRAISKHEDYLTLLSQVSTNSTDRLNLVNALYNVVNISLGSQLYSKACSVSSIAEKNQMLERSESLIRSGSNLDTSSGKLKLATIFFAQGKLQSSLNLVLAVLSTGDTFQLSGFEQPISKHVSVESQFHIIVNRPDVFSEISKSALEVVFLPSEMELAPLPVKFEINRAIEAEKDCHQDDPLQWVTIDSNFYALLLKFLIEHAQGKTQERDLTLSELRQYVTCKDVPFVRRTTALNIVGYCLQLVGEFDWSLDVFLGSLILQKTHNSAAWHLALMAWTAFKMISQQREKNGNKSS